MLDVNVDARGRVCCCGLILCVIHRYNSIDADPRMPDASLKQENLDKVYTTAPLADTANLAGYVLASATPTGDGDVSTADGGEKEDCGDDGADETLEI